MCGSRILEQLCCGYDYAVFRARVGHGINGHLFYIPHKNPQGEVLNFADDRVAITLLP